MRASRRMMVIVMIRVHVCKNIIKDKDQNEKLNAGKYRDKDRQ